MQEKRKHDSPPEPEEKLIAAAEREASDLVVARALRQPAPDAVPGYRILREIGRGGMGVVYEAQQERPPRSVALKMVRGGGFADTHQLKLFEREARTLARLQHPGLAAIYEGGQTRDGYPFYAMELVCGVPLVRYAQEQGLSLRQRLELFRQVCEAVAYAHQRGVIHRDLKPSNILVTADGRPKILDFGLARLTQDDSDLVTTCTLSANVVGTLAYMSPEQASSFPEGVDIRTDVYSLGVTLYELLTGRLPYDLPAALAPNALRTICDQPPRKPSTVDRRLRGEVETIILKALEKEPGRRYQSTAALSEDIHRYLTGQPILAHPPSTVYQLRKLATRHKLPVALGGTLLTVTAGFAVLGTVQAQRIAEQRDRIAAERDRAVTAEAKVAREAERVTSNNEFYRELLRGVGLSVAASSNLQGPLSRAEATGLLNRLAGQVESAFQEDLELRADAHASLATGFLNLRMLSEAEAHVRLALECRGQAFGPADPRYFNTLIDLGRLLQEQSRHEDAGEAFRAGHDGLCATVGEEHPDAIKAARYLATSMNLQYRYEEAEALFRRIRQLQRDMPGWDLLERLWTTRGLARMLMRTGRLQEGEQLAREVIQTAAHGTGRDAGLVLSSGVATLAEALGQQGRCRRAHELMQQQVAITRQLHGDLDPGVEHFRAASAWYLWQTGDQPQAEATLREILAGQRSALGLSSGYTRITMSFLGRLLNAAGRFAEAEAICLEGVQASERYERLDHGLSLLLMVALGTARHGLGHPAEAEAVFQEASEIFQRFPPLRDILVRTELQRRYGRCLTDLGRYAEAEALLLAAYQGEAQMRGEDHENTRDAVESLIALYDAWGQPDKAAEYRGLLTPAETIASATELAESLIRESGTAEEIIQHLESDPSLPEAVRTRALQRFHNHVQDTETSVAVYWWFLRSPDGDAATYQAALEQAREACRLEPGNGAYLRNLGAALYRVGVYEEALAVLGHAEEANAPRPGESHPADVAFIAMACQRLGRTEQALVELDRLRTLLQDARYAESEELRTLLGEAEAVGRSGA